MFTTFAVWFALAAAVYPLPIAGVVGVVATVGMVVVAFLASMVVTLIAFSAIGTAFVHLSGVER